MKSSAAATRPLDSTWLPTLLLVVVALLVRVIDLGRRSLWSDEAYSWWFATQDLSTLWANGGPDPHHPSLYYSVLHWVLPFSHSEAALRAPSVLASAVLAGLIFLIADRLATRPVAWFAGILAMLSPMDVWYAQEARQAALAACLVFVAAYGMTRKDITGRLIGLLGLIAGLFTYYIVPLAWMAILGVALVLGWRKGQELAREWVIITIPAAAVFWPIQGQHFVSGFDSLRSLGDRPFLNTFMNLTGPGGSPVGVLALAVIGAAGAAILFAFLLKRAPQLTVALAVIAYAGSLLVPFAERAYSLQRVVIVGWPVVIIAFAFAASQVRTRWYRAISTSLVLMSLLATLASVLVIEKDDWRAAISHINEQAAEGDIAWITVFTDQWGYGPYLFYDIRLPLHHASDPHDYSSVASNATGDIWIVASRTPRDPVPSTGVEEWLDDNWEEASSSDFHRVAVKGYRNAE